MSAALAFAGCFEVRKPETRARAYRVIKTWTGVPAARTPRLSRSAGFQSLGPRNPDALPDSDTTDRGGRFASPESTPARKSRSPRSGMERASGCEVQGIEILRNEINAGTGRRDAVQGFNHAVSPLLGFPVFRTFEAAQQRQGRGHADEPPHGR